jgi:sec-independent protein translocase protein TatC
MPFLEHLEELRKRLIHCVTAIIVGLLICIYFSERLFNLLANPIIKLLEGSPLIFITPTAPFFAYLKVDLIVGLLIALPYILYELWKFICPGLHTHERKLAAPFIIAAAMLFYAGVAFAYFLVFPAALKFLLSFTTPELKPMIDITAYVSLAVMLMAAFGGIVETPIIIVFLGMLGLFSSDFLKRGRRYFVVLAFIIAAILSPSPDVVNQTLMAVPMLIFYEVGIFLLAIIEKRRRERAEMEDQEEMEDETDNG